MRLAFYKGPAADFRHKLGHWLVCVGTMSRYSHCELQVGDFCWSSSYMDGGVRAKRMDLTSGKWDVVDLGGEPQEEAAALAWFVEHKGKHYDWPGIVRFVLPFVKQKPDEYFCSEAVAAALIASGLLAARDESGITPKDLDEWANHRHIA